MVNKDEKTKTYCVICSFDNIHLYIYIYIYIYVYNIYNLQLTSHHVQVPYPAVSTIINKNEREAFSRKSSIASY